MSLLSDPTLQIVLLAAVFIGLEGRDAVSRQLWNVFLKIKLYSRSSAGKCFAMVTKDGTTIPGTDPQEDLKLATARRLLDQARASLDKVAKY
jgi:hypothetical protein